MNDSTSARLGKLKTTSIRTAYQASTFNRARCSPVKHLLWLFAFSDNICRVYWWG